MRLYKKEVTKTVLTIKKTHQNKPKLCRENNLSLCRGILG